MVGHDRTAERDDRQALVRAALALQGHLDHESVAINAGDLPKAKRVIAEAKDAGQKLLTVLPAVKRDRHRAAADQELTGAWAATEVPQRAPPW